MSDAINLDEARAKCLAHALDTIFGQAQKLPPRPAIKMPMKREAEFELSHLGAKWNCEVEFTLFDEITGDEAAVSVIEIALDGKMIDYEDLPYLEQDEVLAACVASVRE